MVTTHFESVSSSPQQSFVEIWYGDRRIGPPTPLIEFGEEVVRNAANDRILTTRTITLNGTYINTPSGTYNEVEAAQETLLDIFSTDGNQFALRAGPGNAFITEGTYLSSGIFPRVRSISVPQGLQVTDFDYSVVLEYDNQSGVNSGLIESVTDNWSWTENGAELTVDIVHTVTIKGRNTATSGASNNAYINAADFGGGRLGLSNAPGGFPRHVEESQTPLYEISTNRTESVGIEEGTYSATENFKIGSGVHPFNHFRTVNAETDRNGITTVSLQGTIQGFGRTNIGPSGNIGLNNAVSGWLNQVKPFLYADAVKFYDDLEISGTLSSRVLALSQAQSEFAGNINYSAQFSDAPADNLPSGIAERSVTVNRQDPIEIIARHPIPFRALSTILQPMGTPNDGRISISAQARAVNTGDEETDTNLAIAQVESDINAVRPDPTSSEFLTLELESTPTLNYDVKNLSANAQVTYIFTLDLAAVNSASGNVVFPRYGGGL